MAPEELQLLRSQPRHYLWDKKRKDWTEEDLQNLRNGIGAVEKRNKPNPQKQPVYVLPKNGEAIECKSVVEASCITKISVGVIYNILNGYTKQKEEFHFYKTKP